MILLVTACGADDRVVAPLPALVAARQAAFDAEAQGEIAAAAQGRHQRGFEDDLLSLEALVPEVGGAYLDADGEFVLLLTDLTQRTKAGAHLRTLGAGWRLPVELRARLGAGRFRVASARYSFSSLVVWQRALGAARGMTEAGVVTLDADERSNRVVAGVATPQQTALVRAAAIRAGVPAEALTVNVVGTPRAAETLQATISRPTGGGVQIARPTGAGQYRICSLGWNVRNDAGDQGFLTAAHFLSVSDMVTGATGAPFFLPRPDIQQVGTTAGSRPFNPTSLGCEGFTYCTAADAIFVRYFTLSNGFRA